MVGPKRVEVEVEVYMCRLLAVWCARVAKFDRARLPIDS